MLGCPVNCPNCTGPICDKLDPETLTTLESVAIAASAAAQASTIATIIIPAVVSTAGSTVAVFLDFLGEISLFQYINVPFPANFEAFMQFFSASIFPNLLAKAYDESESVTSTNGKFEEYECSRVFLDNCGGGLDKEFLAIAVIIITSILASVLKNCPKAHSIICKVRDNYKWNGFLAFYIGDFQEFFVFTLLQFKESVEPLFSLIFSVLLMASYFVWYLYLSVALNRRKKVAQKPRNRSRLTGSRRSTIKPPEQEDEEEIGDIPESMNMVVDEFVRKNWYSRNFLLIMCLQNVIISFILVFLQNWGTIQAAIYVYIAILYAVLVLGAFRPFKEKSQVIAFSISQFAKGSMGCLAVILGLDEKLVLFSEDQKNAVGIALITLAGIGIGGGFLLSLGMIAMSIIEYCRKYRKNKNSKEQKPQESKIHKTYPRRSKTKKMIRFVRRKEPLDKFEDSEDSYRLESRKTSSANLMVNRPMPYYSIANASPIRQQEQQVNSGNSEQTEYNFTTIIRPQKRAQKRKVITHRLFKNN